MNESQWQQLSIAILIIFWTLVFSGFLLSKQTNTSISNLVRIWLHLHDVLNFAVLRNVKHSWTESSFVTDFENSSSSFVLQIQVLTNGVYKAVQHRASPNTQKVRLSLVYSAYPPATISITPAPEFVSATQPALYKPFTWSEYMSGRVSHILNPIDGLQPEPTQTGSGNNSSSSGQQMTSSYWASHSDSATKFCVFLPSIGSRSDGWDE